MYKRNLWRVAALSALSAGLLWVGGASSQRPRAAEPSTTFVPRFEALAETELLMEGLTNANFRGLQGLLKEEPGDVETWKFARGQALFVGETGNLLLLRPPRNSGRNTWMKRAMDMRDAAAVLAQRTGKQDYAGSKRAMEALATSCNRCHQTFRVPTRIHAWGPPTKAAAE